MSLQTTTLDNGLRIITDTVPTVDSVATGIWVGAGTRDEDLQYNGAAHMVEHMLFKGTDKRSAKDIAEEIENVGGHMNAYTSREITSYHAHLLKDDLSLALDVLSDMIQHSTMPDAEIERERDVILQEIGMCNDTPDDLIFDHLFETAWSSQALGAPILGTVPIIQSMEKDALSSYVKKLYTPHKVVVSAAGNVEHGAFVTQVQDHLTHLSSANAYERQAAHYDGGERRVFKDLEQTHITLGFQAIPRTHEDYYTAKALSTILGGGMSSRLFQEVREKRGLVYSVYSFYSPYSDDGLFGIYAGTGPDKLNDLMPVICDEINNMRINITHEELTRAKAQMKTSMLMGRESMMRRADSQAKHLIHFGDQPDINTIIDQIESICVEDVQRVASSIFSTVPTLTALGPLQQLEPYDHLRKRIAA